MDTFEQLNAVFCRVFDDNDIKITPEMTANDIDEWDSFSNTILVRSIEKHFKIIFKSSEIMRWKNIGQIYDSIKEKLSEKM